MIKHNAIAMAFPVLLITGAANAVEIYNKDGNKIDLYGKADVQRTFSKSASQEGDGSVGRVGIRGSTQITDKMTGYGRWEFNMIANGTEVESGEKTRTRYAFAGLKFGEYGSLDYGRNMGVIYDVNSWTDNLPVFGGDSMSATDNYMMGRSTGLLTYRNTDFFGWVNGLNFAMQYQAKNDNSTKNSRSDISRQNGDGYGFSSSYDLGNGISIAAAYGSSNRTSAQKLGTGVATPLAKGDKAEAWGVSTKYDRNNVYLAAMYGETRNLTRFGSSVDNHTMFANKTQNIELTAQYQFDFGFRPSLGFVYSKGKDLGNDLANKGILTDKDSEDLVKYVSVGAYYDFNKNMGTYFEYQFNLLKDNDFTKKANISTDDVFGVGLVYRF
ncbi:porin [Xenorhabdus nematophila]|uniref:porin n=1 Tax=Xenorhabdus nematophila TaxID=628 RepID=UPI0005438721|nr:porin [Xenorhabdus nematophila]CEF28736.1 growth-phase-regulated outer membrane protein OpnS [Xenorhabdus nematophila str. Websteri]AYA42334.1 porin [Xenorhabdus nematophila]KHD29200.1 porin [Xenorhabdus nematophila]MCB4424845.1 porin [Xenorhabdus nematophila]CEF31992.1 growth-phase-regulated outer membrane protein OpnS [Xenorhabdus nematophila str. Websteri]